ncbi:site-2 protease family protein [Chitinophaga sancti]|uniref:Zinc metalloprotease n=1 Tax=Chitinophaga sancti TaxID=1004 RepID=A0A1K1SLD9_9BACT|nr:site-2 protease family protein [Chitinophaga sancti]WQD63873.1 site-2 protease family protein [Chitinophaga sancti]WQG90502.1 site-2 protease family protein [Chitinophaga sancti]SFW85240.1 Zn-dependent protease (includes SpoIVFB) [Chitinophaga sancti]
MKNSINIFFIKGIQIKLHWTFLLFIAWVLFMQVIAREPLHIALVTMGEILAVFMCVLLHELGHAFAAIYYKIPISEIRLLPIGGLTLFTKQPANPTQEVVVSLAGPIVNLLIALAMIPFIPAGTEYWNFSNMISSIHAGNFFHFIYNINVLLTLINLLPILPLDGGKLLKGLAGFIFKPYPAFRLTLTISTAGSLLLTIAGLLTGNLLFILYGCFLLFTSTIEKNNYTISFLLKDETVSDVLSQDYKTIDMHAAREEVLATICSGNDRYYVLTDDTALVGILDKETILSKLLSEKKDMALQDIIIPELPAISADSRIMDVWAGLPGKADLIVPVTSPAKKIIGVISRDNIIGFLLNRMQAQHKKQWHWQ